MVPRFSVDYSIASHHKVIPTTSIQRSGIVGHAPFVKSFSRPEKRKKLCTTRTSAPPPNMKKNTILAVVAYIFPLVGLILWLVNRKKPGAAGKLYGIAALYGVVWSIIDVVLQDISDGNAFFYIISLIVFIVGIVLVVKMARKNVGTALAAGAAETASQQPAEASRKTFFLKRWLVGLGDAMDRWLFKLTPESDNTIGNTFWASLVIGFFFGAIGTAVYLYYSVFKHSRFPSIDTGLIIIVACISLVPMVIYGIKSIPTFATTKERILRGLFIFGWCLVGIALGVGLGIAVIYVAALVLVVWLVLKIFGMAIFGERGGSGTWRLDDGTKVTETSGLLGEKYYEGDNGRSYVRTSDTTFTEK